MSYHLFRNAHKLFVKITQRHKSIKTCLVTQHYYFSTNLYNKQTGFENPTGLYSENEDVISWTSKISSLVKEKQPEEAIELFKVMLMREDQRPNFVTILSVIKAFGVLNRETMIWVAHGLVIKLGFESESSVLTALLGVYSSYDMGTVWTLFDQTLSKNDVVLWSAVITACVKNKQYMEAIECFREMQFLYVKANHVSIVSILPACSGVRGLRFGKQIHGWIIKEMFYQHTNVQNSLMDMYAKCRKLESSIRVFEMIQIKDIVSWRILLHGCIENVAPLKALEFFLEMNNICGFKPDESIIHDAVAASIQAGCTEFGLAFHGYVVKHGFLFYVSIQTALLQTYAKFGKVSSSRMMFDNLNKKDIVLWSVMISLYAQCGQTYNAFDTFKEMVSMNEKPNEHTFVSLLQACSCIEALEFGESIHGHATKTGYLSNPYITSSLVHLYCKFGRTKQGKTLFNEIPFKDLIGWSSMISGYVLNGCGTEALQTFSDMLDHGVKPNDVVFLSVLSACSYCGLEHEGRKWFSLMKEEYGVEPKLPHYACMVDLLSRWGNIEEALDFVKRMRVEPDLRIWGAVLAGCRRLTRGSVEVAEVVVQQLNVLDPLNKSYELILLELYAEEGRWEDVERLKENGGWKKCREGNG